MSDKLNLYQKLAKIQEQVLGLGKDKTAFGYKYVTGSKVLDHIKPLMVSNGILLKQEVLTIDNARQDYATKNGNKSEILSKVMMRFTWVDVDSGDKDENLFGANGQNDWDKGVGSALTYAERYFLLKYFHINTDEDDIDNPDRKDQSESQPLSNEQKIRSSTDLSNLADVWKSIPPGAEKDALMAAKEEMKVKLTPKK
jgi:ERF superfamily protein